MSRPRKLKRIVLSDSEEDDLALDRTLTPSTKLADDLNSLNFTTSSTVGVPSNLSGRSNKLKDNSDDDMDPEVARSAMMGGYSPSTRGHKRMIPKFEADSIQADSETLMPMGIAGITCVAASPMDVRDDRSGVAATTQETRYSSSRSRSISRRKDLLRHQISQQYQDFQKNGLQGLTFDQSDEDSEENRVNFRREKHLSAKRHVEELEDDDSFVVEDDGSVEEDADLYSDDGEVEEERVASPLGRNSEESDGETGDDASESDGKGDSSQLLYLKFNAARDEIEDDDAAFYGLQNKAMSLYLEMIARVLVSQRFRSAWVAGKISKSKYIPFIKAARQLENLICTHRESLLGSSAWKPDFLSQLRSRPFNMSRGAGGHCVNELCQACGRSTQNADSIVVLFGPIYDADKCWSTNRWIESLPKELFCDVMPMPSSGSSKADESTLGSKRAIATPSASSKKQRLMNNEPENNGTDQSPHAKQQWWEKYLPRKFATHKESQWWVAAHCKNRTQLYHTLLHYKFRLALKVREYLESQSPIDLDNVDQTGLDALVDVLVEDSRFHKQELTRLESLLANIGTKYCGDKIETSDQGDIWSKGESSTNRPRATKTSSSVVTHLTFEKKVPNSGPKIQSTLSAWLKR